MTFQISNLKENYFLNLLDDDYLPIKPTYMKSSLWLKVNRPLQLFVYKSNKSYYKSYTYRRI